MERPGDLIPVEHAQIFWNCDDSGRIVEIHLVDRRTPRLYKWAQRFDCDDGASCADWCSDHNNTEILFARLAVDYGWNNKRTGGAVILEFAKISNCGWARELALRLEALGMTAPAAASDPADELAAVDAMLDECDRANGDTPRRAVDRLTRIRVLAQCVTRPAPLLRG